METVVAVKIETILRRGVLSTRPRDYYDVYILSLTCSLDSGVLRQSIQATAARRQSEALVPQWQEILEALHASAIQRQYWNGYRSKFPYARAIGFVDVIVTLRKLLERVFVDSA